MFTAPTLTRADVGATSSGDPGGAHSMKLKLKRNQVIDQGSVFDLEMLPLATQQKMHARLVGMKVTIRWTKKKLQTHS